MKIGKAALYERLLEEKDRQITILVDQVDWLRAQLALAGRAVPAAPLNPTGQPPVERSSTDPLMEAKLHVSDEEMDLEAMRESGDLNGLDAAAIAEIIEGLGLAPEFDLDNVTIQ